MNVKEIWISTSEGKTSLKSCSFIEGFGIKGDLKGGKALKEVVIYATSSTPSTLQGLCTNRFKANLVIEGLQNLKEDSTLKIGQVILHINKVGKTCFNECDLVKEHIHCNLRDNVLFCSVIKGGKLTIH